MCFSTTAYDEALLAKAMGGDPAWRGNTSVPVMEIAEKGLWTGQTHLNFDSQKFEQVGVVPAGVLLFAFDPALFGFLAF